jgi:Leucine-rich repeat (LRR) protein
LSFNRISDISPLAAALAMNTAFLCLSLNNNRISDVSALGAALATNVTLTELKWVKHTPLLFKTNLFLAACLKTTSATFPHWGQR